MHRHRLLLNMLLAMCYVIPCRMQGLSIHDNDRVELIGITWNCMPIVFGGYGMENDLAYDGLIITVQRQVQVVTHSLTYPNTYSQTLTYPNRHTDKPLFLCLSLSHSLSLSLSLSLPFSLSFSLSRTHTHTKHLSLTHSYCSACFHLMVIKFIVSHKLLCDYMDYTIGSTDCILGTDETRKNCRFGDFN